MATIYDLIEVTNISPDTTYSLANGNLLGVVDGMTSPQLDDGEFDIGDIVTIGGVNYTIDRIQEPLNSGRFTEGDGTDNSFNPGSETNLDAVFLTISNGTETRYFIIPNDRYGDMNVEQIRTGSLEDVGGNDSAIISTTDNNVNVVCFVDGTMIETERGEIPVEDIRVGDLVPTRDHGPQAVQVIIVREIEFDYTTRNLRPIAMERGSLGTDRPERRLCVSPQHRVLLTTADGNEVLVPAKALTERPGVHVMRGRNRVCYYHLVFSRHEIICANGVLTESFYPGPMAMKSVPESCRIELESIFGDVVGQVVEQDDQAAAPILTVQQARRLANTLR